MLNDTTTRSTSVMSVVLGVPNHDVKMPLLGPAARNTTSRIA
ncbi:hypothetical protein BC477_12625 [Clavibacter michiganensis subsp. michiganensis]|uniref:Uncharacterized protein n=1 Tax=Clavibacter michiganensis subsp. michiganensis TaxID=33013 RepID=A0A251XIK2_CLAMM|nr:hypothetical protein BC477_12625 [Clavibacter michiganensis subsp. michiganensis]OUE02642.1 hypothetical protein CMMCAS07_11530 [Clavibacter michiganensis subsp. michiganensis]